MGKGIDYNSAKHKKEMKLEGDLITSLILLPFQILLVPFEVIFGMGKAKKKRRKRR